ncbi:hypothetical protein PFISCL1PPCAC_27403, partial [Pristionchus fissidentatus]
SLFAYRLPIFAPSLIFYSFPAEFRALAVFPRRQSMEKTKRVDTIDNLPPSRVRQVGAWTEQFSSNGRRYFYNRESEVSQWDKPIAWIEAEAILDPDIDNDDQYSCASLGRDSDRNGSSPEKIDVSDDEISPMEEDPIISEEEQRQRALEAERLAEEEKQRLEAERQYNKDYGYRRFLNQEAMDKIYKEVLCIEKPSTPPPYPTHLSRYVDDYNFQLEYNEKMLEASRARLKAESSYLSAKLYEKKADGVCEIREEMEERRLNFQANFDTQLGALVAQSKNEEDFVPDMLKRAWIEWPTDKILRCHEGILEHRSEEFQDMEHTCETVYRPKPPTPSPTPSPSYSGPPPNPVILDAKKLKELEVRSPSPSYEEQPMEMVVSPVYEDEYDPTARAIHSPVYSSRSSCSGSSYSSPDASRPFKTQEYTRPTSERPLNFILEPPPAFPVLDLAAIEASERRKRRTGSESPIRSPVRSPPLSPRTSPTIRSPPMSPTMQSPINRFPQSPHVNPYQHVRSPDVEPLDTVSTTPVSAPIPVPVLTPSPISATIPPPVTVPIPAPILASKPVPISAPVSASKPAPVPTSIQAPKPAPIPVPIPPPISVPMSLPKPAPPPPKPTPMPTPVPIPMPMGMPMMPMPHPHPHPFAMPFPLFDPSQIPPMFNGKPVAIFDPTIPPPPFIPNRLPPPLPMQSLPPPPPAPILDKLFQECEIEDPF